jgi:SAM-dependent methyltransferase
LGTNAEQAFVEFYDYVVPYRDRQDVGFFVEMARESGGPILEIGCGTGRILLPTARAGIELVGLDSSPLMLSVCRRKLAGEPAAVQTRVELVEADMRGFDLGREFRLVTLPFRPFQHLLTVEDQLSCLAAIRRHLASGGRLVLDVFNPDLARLVGEQYLEESEGEPEFTLPDGRKVIRRDRVVARDLFQQWQDIELIYYVWYPDGREERLVYPSRMRYFFRFELEHLLVRAGFRVEDVYADYDRSPYGAKFPGELILVARKD